MNIFDRSKRSGLVAYNTASQVVGKVISAATTLGVSILIARQFGAQGYGEYTKIITFVTFFYLMSDFGLNAIFLQRVEGADRQKLAREYARFVGLRVIVGVVLVFLALAVLSLLPQGVGDGYTAFVRLGIIVFVPTILFQAGIQTANSIFQHSLRYDLATIALFVGSIVTVGAVYSSTVIFRDQFGLLASIASVALGGLVTVLVAGSIARVRTGGGITFDMQYGRDLLRRAFPLGVTLLFNIVYMRADSVILTLTRSTVDVGVYGFATKVFDVPLAVPTFFMNAVYPLLLRAKKGEGAEAFTRLLKRSGRVLLVVSIIVGVSVWVFAPWVVLFSDAFAESAAPLRILALGLPLFFLSSLSMWGLIAQKRQGLLAMIYAVGMIVNVSANAYFIPRFGVTAAAWVTVWSEAGILLATAYALRASLPGRRGSV